MRIHNFGLFRGIHGLQLVALCAAGFVVDAPAQAFTKADSGWVRIFNGTNLTGWYSRTYGASAQRVTPPATPYSVDYAGTDTAAIRVGTNGTGNPVTSGNIGTLDSTFSHYRFRVEAKYDQYGNGSQNAGLTYHTDESKARMQNNWPRSIEFQFRQNETGDAFSIQQVTFDIRTTSSSSTTWSSTSSTVRTGCATGCAARSFAANPRKTTAAGSGTTTTSPTRWLRYMLIARGADSATHIVNDTVVLALSNIRIFNDNTQTPPTPSGPHGSGRLTLQAEGALLRYRRIEIMQFPASTPKTAPYLHRLFLDQPATPVKPSPGAQVALAWRSIGTLPSVKIEYRSGAGAWQTAVESVPNTGSYSWTAPGSVPDSLRFRISSADYVWADSTGAGPVSIHHGLPESGKQVFTVKNGALLVPGVAEYDRMEILDPSGRLVRALPLSGADARWDLTAASGAKVRPGLYFFRLTGSGSGAPYHGRVMVL